MWERFKRWKAREPSEALIVYGLVAVLIAGLLAFAWEAKGQTLPDCLEEGPLPSACIQRPSKYRKPTEGCLDLRHRSLVRWSFLPARVEGCRVVEGLWADPYTGAWTTDPRDLHLEHVVPFRYAMDQRSWTQEEAEDYFNDDRPYQLWVVSARENRRKGKRGPSKYLPPNPWLDCGYAEAFRVVSERWEFELPAEDEVWVTATLDNCAPGSVPSLMRIR